MVPQRSFQHPQQPRGLWSPLDPKGVGVHAGVKSVIRFFCSNFMGLFLAPLNIITMQYQ